MTGGGYEIGPALAHDEDPWSVGWEQDPRVVDGHAHEWESVLLMPGPRRGRLDEVVRCRTCRAPRCGHALHENDPCMERRHHLGPHVPLSTLARA